MSIGFASPNNEKLIGRRCIVVSVGLYPGNARSAIISVGLNDGDVVILVNSEPREVPKEVLRGGRRQPTEAMEAIRRFINEAFGDIRIEVHNVWLNPKLKLIDNVTTLRALIEDLAPCRVVIAMAGGLRWISAALMFLALALKTVGVFNNIVIDKVFTMLEEESPSIRAAFPSGLERIIEWPFIPRITEVSRSEYDVLRLIAAGVGKAKDIHKKLDDARVYGRGISMASVQRILVKLRRKGLVDYEPVGKAYRYRLTPLGKLLVSSPQKQ